MTTLRHYETIIIFSPDLKEAGVEKKVKEYTSFLEKQKADIIYKEVIAKRRLAMPIKKKAYGIYYVIEFKGAPTIVDLLELQYRRDADVLRFMTLILDEEAILYKAKKREEKAKKKREKADNSKKDNE